MTPPARLVSLFLTGAVFLATGCSSPEDSPRSSDNSEQACPSGAAFGVIWSSDTTRTQVQFYSHSELLGYRDIDVRNGVTFDAVATNENSAFTITNGSPSETQVDLIEISLSDCTTKVTSLPSAGVYAFTVDESNAYALDGRNWAVGLHRVHLDTSESASLQYPEEMPDTVAATESRITLFTSNISEGTQAPTTTMRVYHKTSMELEWEQDLPVPSVGQPAVSGETLYIGGVLTTEEVPDSQWFTIDLNSHEYQQETLSTPLPSIARTQEDRVYIGHTFMNPSFKPMWEYRDLTVLNTRADTESRYTLDEGIIQFEVTDEALISLGEVREDTYQITSYDLDQMQPQQTLSLLPPNNLEHVYPVGFFLLKT